MTTLPNLKELPFLKSLLWQGESPNLGDRTESEIIQIYERGWHYLGVLSDLSETERLLIHRLAKQYHSWLINEV